MIATSASRIAKASSGLSYIAEIVPIIQLVRECRDPKDDKFLEVARNGGADLIMTGIRPASHRPLDLVPKGNIHIVVGDILLNASEEMALDQVASYRLAQVRLDLGVAIARKTV